MADRRQCSCPKFDGDNPVLIYLPEVAFDQDAFIEKVKENLWTAIKDNEENMR